MGSRDTKALFVFKIIDLSPDPKTSNKRVKYSKIVGIFITKKNAEC